MLAPPGRQGAPGSSARRSVAWLGIVLLVVGLVLVGASLVVLGQAEQAELSCITVGPQGSSCQSTVDNAENNTVTALGILGVGVIVAGVGAGVVAAVIIDIMARRERDFPAGPLLPGLAPGPAPGPLVAGAPPAAGPPPPVLPSPPQPPSTP